MLTDFQNVSLLIRSDHFDQRYNKTNSVCHHRSIVSLISLSCGNIAHAGILPACLRHLGNIPATSRNQPHYWPQWQSLFAYYSLLDIILSFYILLEYPWSDKLSYLATSFSTWYIFLQLMLCCCYLTLAQFGVFGGIIRSSCVLNIWAELVFSIGVKLSLTTSTLQAIALTISVIH